MLRMSKLTDYGIVLLTHLARSDGPGVRTAQELARTSNLPLPTVSKLLKELSRSGLVSSQRGRRGGYTLARSAHDITVAQILEALEGPVALTECSSGEGACDLEPVCVARSHWGPISRAIQRTLSRLPLSALAPRPIQIGRPKSALPITNGVA